METVDIYTTPQCGFCNQLKESLTQKEIIYEAHDVTKDTNALDEMKRLTKGALSVPVTVIDKGTDDEIVAIGYQSSLKALKIVHEATEDKEQAEMAILTCPDCGHQQQGEIPTESCVPFYECEGCNKTIKAEGENCCVFCSYADKPCPLKSGDKGECSDGACNI